MRLKSRTGTLDFLFSMYTFRNPSWRKITSDLRKNNSPFACDVRQGNWVHWMMVIHLFVSFIPSMNVLLFFQLSKFLDSAGSKLNYRRYAETLLDVLFAGGILGMCWWSVAVKPVWHNVASLFLYGRGIHKRKKQLDSNRKYLPVLHFWLLYDLFQVSVVQGVQRKGPMLTTGYETFLS